MALLVACNGSTSEVDGGTADAVSDVSHDTPDAHTSDAPGRDSALPPVDEACAAPGYIPAHDEPPTEPTHWVTSSDNDGPGSLRELLATVEDESTIGVDAALAGATIELNEELVVSARNLVLDGRHAPGITLDAGRRSRVMSVDKNRDFTIIGFRIVGGVSDAGSGGLRARQADEGQPERNLRVIGCTFENNSGPRAGGLFVGWRVHAEVIATVFRNNDATSGDAATRGFSGGAIATKQSGSLHVRRSVFESNRGYKAGAVYNILQPLEIEDSVFVGNRAIDGSGAVVTDGGNPFGPSNESFDGSIAIHQTWFEDNHGQEAGGAILLWGYPGDAIELDRVTMIANTCDDEDGDSKGGAARLHGHLPLRVTNSLFAHNQSEQQGGALWIDGQGDLLVENSTFLNNTTPGLGGGFVYNGRVGSVRVESSAFVENVAGNACGAFFWASRDTDVSVRNTYFVENRADDLTSRHVRMPVPTDEGGNLEWVRERPERGRVFAESVFADPMLSELQSIECGLGMLGGDALIGSGVEGVTRDAAGRTRETPPDIGPYEH